MTTPHSNTLLIGFMASGKSSVGRLLAQRSDRWFIDTDALIATMAGKSISAIFEEEGEGRFRAWEVRLSKWLQDHITGAVIATGGGMPLVCNNLKAIGEVIWLDAPLEVIESRLAQPGESGSRPLADEALQTRYHERRSIYARTAHRQIDASGSVEAVLERLFL